MARENTTAREVIISTLAALEVAGYLTEAGLPDDDVSALRRRLVGS